jgi:predicted PurR-regulated permease PerM
MVPYISSWAVSIPAAVQLWFSGQAPLGILLLLFHLGTYFLVDPWIYEMVESMHPSFTSLSILMGFYAFDLPGIIFGPFLVLAAIITREIFTEIYKQNSTGTAADPRWTSSVTDTEDEDE